MQRRVLVVAGSDSGGGAGIQGDIKTITCLGFYAATAITALTAQNTHGVQAIYSIPPDFIRRQMRAVLEDIGADAIKTGMLHDAGVIEAVAMTLQEFPAVPLVVDPVMIAKGGAALLQGQAVRALKERLFPRAALLTPNVPEAEHLTGLAIRDMDDMRRAARALQTMGCANVLLKGGHLPGETVIDLLVEGEHETVFTQARIEGRHTHGTGCALASACAALMAGGATLHGAVAGARDYVRAAMLAAPGIGSGHGPLGHNFMLKKSGA